MEEVKKESSATSTKPSSSLEEEVLVVSPSKPKFPALKKKVLITYFDDRTTEGEEVLGDWVAEKLVKEVNRRSLQILFDEIDPPSSSSRSRLGVIRVMWMWRGGRFFSLA